MNRLSVEIPRLVGADISSDMGLLLAKLHTVGSRLNNDALSEFGLRERAFSVLTLACSGLEPTQRELAEFLSLNPSQIVRLVDDLERQGLVERVQGKLDRRANIIISTAGGWRLHELARAALSTTEASQLANLSSSERRQLRSLLRKALWA